MLKIKKYKEEIEKFDSGRKNIICYLAQLSNTINPSYCNGVGCSTCLKNSLLELMKECKEPIKLTKFEYEFLKYVRRLEKNYVARDKNDEIYAFNNKPYQNETIWQSEISDYYELHFDELFKFVKWEDEEPWKIEEILSNCEVVEDE